MSSSYLFQRGVRDTVAAEAKVSRGPVELSEKHGKGSICGAAVGQDVGDLLTNALQEDRLRDVALHQLTKGCQICQRPNNRKKEKMLNFQMHPRLSPLFLIFFSDPGAAA